MSASLLVDLQNTCQQGNSINSVTNGSGVGSSGVAFPGSGALVGLGINLQNADTLCNVLVTGINQSSGQLRIQVQCSDTDVSGNYTDPTSGMQTFPTSFVSGGILVLGSGFNSGSPQLSGIGLLGAFVSGQSMNSGFSVAGGFQRTNVFARAIALSGDGYVGPLNVDFISQYRFPGSGGGVSQQPAVQSGVNVFIQV